MIVLFMFLSSFLISFPKLLFSNPYNHRFRFGSAVNEHKKTIASPLKRYYGLFIREAFHWTEIGAVRRIAA